MHPPRLGGDRRIDGVGHRDRIGEVEPGEFRLGRAERGDGGLDVDAELGEWRADGAELVGERGDDDGIASTDVPADELEGEPGVEHHLHSVGIDPHVELRDRVDIADVIGGGAHDHDTGDPLGERRVATHGEGDVGEWPERDEGELAGMGVGGLDERVDRMTRVGFPSTEGEADIAHAVVAVNILGGAEFEHQWSVGPNVDWDVAASADLAGVEGVLHGGVEGHVPGNHSDADDVDSVVGQRESEGDGVVAGGVGIDEERTCGHRGNTRCPTSRGISRRCRACAPPSHRAPRRRGDGPRSP